MTDRADRLLGVERYYSAKLAEHGPQALGVDWATRESQRLRFQKLLTVCDASAPFSLNDWGCGYGALLDELPADVSYTGLDVSEAMLEAARKRYAGRPGTRFVRREEDLAAADFTLASGIFNVKLETPEAEWAEYVAETIDRIARVSTCGFAFNVLSSYSDPPRRRPHLYYADPAFWFDHCKRKHSRFVSLLHDYPLWEFTLVVRRTG